MLSLHQNLKGLVRVKFHHLYHMTKNKLAIFDFDGTISKIDSTKFFLKFPLVKFIFLWLLFKIYSLIYFIKIWYL